MATSYPSVHQYTVQDQDSVSLSVVIGQGAIGSSLVILDGNHLVAGTGVQNFRIGTGASLRGKVLVITSAMVATHSLTSQTVSLTGGAPQSWTDQHAAAAGDNVVYVCVVQFI
jgi:hypothetical protein